MSFRGKVKAVLRVNESDRLRRRDQAHGLQGEDAWMKKWNAMSDAEKDALRRQPKKQSKKVKKKVKKVTVDQAHKIARERRKKVKFKKPTPAKIAAAQQRDRKADAERAANPRTAGRNKRQLARINAQPTGREKVNPESITDNSEHPFYQKVKELSRGKKNKSLLEKKSNSVKTFKILLGKVDKKSKMVAEGKREDAAKKRREIAKRTKATREKRAAEEKRAREARQEQSELVKKGRRGDEQPDSPAHDATHERRSKPRTNSTSDIANDTMRKMGLPSNWF